MHPLNIWSLATLLTVSLAADGLDTPNLLPRANGACTQIAQLVSGASQVYYAGLTFLYSVYQQCN